MLAPGAGRGCLRESLGMARMTPHLCAAPFARTSWTGPGCAEHRRGSRSSGSPGYGSKWARIRNAYIAEHPRCQDCGSSGPWLDVHHVDHARPGDPTFLDSRVLRTLCRSCHRSVTEHAKKEIQTKQSAWA